MWNLDPLIKLISQYTQIYLFWMKVSTNMVMMSSLRLHLSHHSTRKSENLRQCSHSSEHISCWWMMFSWKTGNYFQLDLQPKIGNIHFVFSELIAWVLHQTWSYTDYKWNPRLHKASGNPLGPEFQFVTYSLNTQTESIWKSLIKK